VTTRGAAEGPAHILAWEGGANWFWFEGNFASYEQNKIGRLGADFTRLTRVSDCQVE
jgi:hypothetical protein